MKSLLYVMILFFPLFATDTLVAAIGVRLDKPIAEVPQEFINEVNLRANKEFFIKLEYRPYNRGKVRLCSGGIDIDFSRVFYAYDDCDSVIRIDVKLFESKLYAYGKAEMHDSIAVHPDSSLRYISLLGNQLSDYWFEKSGIVPHRVTDYQNAVKMIALGRGDCFVSSVIFSKDTVMDKNNVIADTIPLFSAGNYVFIHRSKERYLPKLFQIIDDLIRDDYLNQLYNALYNSHQ